MWLNELRCGQSKPPAFPPLVLSSSGTRVKSQPLQKEAPRCIVWVVKIGIIAVDKKLKSICCRLEKMKIKCRIQKWNLMVCGIFIILERS